MFLKLSTLFFKDLTPDDQDITYADAFASGQLSQEFYKDGTGAIIKASDETPAFNAKGEYQWTEEQAKEYLRNPIHYNHNVDKFAEYFGNATSELHNNEFRTKMAGNDRYLKTASGDFFGSVANVNAAKVNTYVDMLVDRDLVAGGSAVQKSIDNLRNSLNRKGIKQPPGTEAGHNVNGSGKNGWESVAKNRAVETKNKRKLRIK